MNTILPTAQRSAEVAARIERLAETYHADAELRARADEDPHGVLAENGFDLPRTLDVRLAVNTDDVFHVAMPPDPNADLSDDALTSMSGGGCFGCLSCPFSCASTDAI